MNTNWYCSDGQQTHGPVSAEQLSAMIQSEQLVAEHFILPEGSGEWETIGASDFAIYLPPATPPTPVAVPQPAQPQASPAAQRHRPVQVRASAPRQVVAARPVPKKKSAAAWSMSVGVGAVVFAGAVFLILRQRQKVSVEQAQARKVSPTLSTPHIATPKPAPNSSLPLSSPAVTRLVETTGGEVFSVDPLADGKIILRGTFKTVAGVSVDGFARLNADGTVDPSFKPELRPGGLAPFFRIQADGRMLVGSSFASLKSGIARLHVDGTLDKSFKSDWAIQPDLGGYAALQPAGKILFWGVFDAATGLTGSMITRLNADGTLDSSFKSDRGYEVFDSLTLDNGRIIIWGSFSTKNGAPRNNIARLDESGATDPTFQADANGEVRYVQLQKDGKLIVRGQFTQMNGTACDGFARLNPDGTIDTTFRPNLKMGAPGRGPRIVDELVLQGDGRMIVVGTMGSVDGVTRDGLARLNPDGTLDRSFDPKIEVVKKGRARYDYPVSGAHLQAHGRILIHGFFTSIAGTSRPGLARLMPDGSLDTTFNPPAAEYLVVEALQPDGKILVRAGFNIGEKYLRLGIFRLNPDGSPDQAFGIPSELAPPSSAITEQPAPTKAPVAHSTVEFVEWPASAGGNGHRYAITEKATDWTAAEAAAVALGGHLASITSIGEQAFINQSFLKDQREGMAFWIGLSADEKRVFHWTTGEPFVYNNWKKSEPNNSKGNEAYAAMNWEYASARSGASKGTWNDVPLGGTTNFGGKTKGPYFGIIEIGDPREIAAAPSAKEPPSAAGAEYLTWTFGGEPPFEAKFVKFENDLVELEPKDKKGLRRMAIGALDDKSAAQALRLAGLLPPANPNAGPKPMIAAPFDQPAGSPSAPAPATAKELAASLPKGWEVKTISVQSHVLTPDGGLILLVGTDTGNGLLKVSLKDGKPVWGAGPMALEMAGNPRMLLGKSESVFLVSTLADKTAGGDIALACVSASDGKVRWRQRYDGAQKGDDRLGYGSLALNGAGDLLVGVVSGGAPAPIDPKNPNSRRMPPHNSTDSVVLTFAAADGKLLREGKALAQADKADGIREMATDSHGHALLYAETEYGQSKLVDYDADTDKLLWEFAMPSSLYGAKPLTDAAGIVLLPARFGPSSSAFNVICLSRDGKKSWAVSGPEISPRYPQALVVGTDLVCIATASRVNGAMLFRAFNRADGKLRWQKDDILSAAAHTSKANNRDYFDHVLLADKPGNVFLGWTQPKGEEYQVVLAKFSPKGDVLWVQQLAERTAPICAGLQYDTLILDEQGNPVILYEQAEPGSKLIDGALLSDTSITKKGVWTIAKFDGATGKSMWQFARKGIVDEEGFAGINSKMTTDQDGNVLLIWSLSNAPSFSLLKLGARDGQVAWETAIGKPPFNPVVIDSPELRKNGAFGFPQASATVLADMKEARVSAWSNAEYLYVQTIVWADGNDALGKLSDGREIGDSDMLLIDIDADQRVTSKLDRTYTIDPWPNKRGLYYQIRFGEDSSTTLMDDSQGRGSVQYVPAAGGSKLRVDSFLIPLTELGKKAGDKIRLVISGRSEKPDFAFNSARIMMNGAMPRYPSIPGQAYHEFTLGQQTSKLDPALVPEGRSK